MVFCCNPTVSFFRGRRQGRQPLIWMTGWWWLNHLEKWWSSSMELGWQPIYEMENKIHVPKISKAPTRPFVNSGDFWYATAKKRPTIPSPETENPLQAMEDEISSWWVSNPWFTPHTNIPKYYRGNKIDIHQEELEWISKQLMVLHTLSNPNSLTMNKNPIWIIASH